MLNPNITCPTCNKAFPDSACFVFDEGDFPDLTDPSMFPGEVLEFPCGHGQALQAGEVSAPTDVDRRCAAIEETVFHWDRKDQSCEQS